MHNVTLATTESTFTYVYASIPSSPSYILNTWKSQRCITAAPLRDALVTPTRNAKFYSFETVLKQNVRN